MSERQSKSRSRVPPPPPAPLQHPAVLVMRVPGEQPGQERIELRELNGIDGLSVPIMLRLAAKIKENQLGIGSD